MLREGFRSAALPTYRVDHLPVSYQEQPPVTVGDRIQNGDVVHLAHDGGGGIHPAGPRIGFLRRAQRGLPRKVVVDSMPMGNAQRRRRPKCVDASPLPAYRDAEEAEENQTD